MNNFQDTLNPGFEPEVYKGTWTKFSSSHTSPGLAVSIFRDFLNQSGLSEWAATDLPKKLLKGDAHVFIPLESEAPRFCLRLYNGLIDEVFSSKPHWETDPKAWATIQNFASDLPGHERFRKITIDSRLLSFIEIKIEHGVVLDKSDLSFIYEIDRKFRTIRPEGRARLEKVLSSRDCRSDLAEIFGCAPDTIALSKKEISHDTRVVAVKLQSGDGAIVNSLKASTIFTKDVSLDGDPALVLVPPHTQFLGRFTARNCPNLKGIGASTLFLKDAYFDDSVNLSSFGNGVEFRARAGFLRCAGLQTYPRTVRFLGAIDFEGSGVEEIPEGTSFIGTVIFSKTPIREIPPGTEFNLGCEFKDCPQLINIGAGSLFRGRANFSGCPSLESTGEGVRFLGPVSFESSGLRLIATGAEFFGDADFSDTPQLKGVPDGVTFGGPARFSGSGIHAIGEGVLFKGPVHLKQCCNLSVIDNSVVFEGPLYVRHCPNLLGFESGD
jgi:hypothetical protein